MQAENRRFGAEQAHSSLDCPQLDHEVQYIAGFSNLSDRFDIVSSIGRMTWRPDHPFFAHVHPLFWPVLWWNLHRFVARLEVLMTLYGRDARLSWRVSWYGVIEIYAVHPVPQRSWRHVLADCRVVVARACSEPVTAAAQLMVCLRPATADGSQSSLLAPLRGSQAPAFLESG